MIKPGDFIPRSLKALHIETLDGAEAFWNAELSKHEIGEAAYQEHKNDAGEYFHDQCLVCGGL